MLRIVVIALLWLMSAGPAMPEVTAATPPARLLAKDSKTERQQRKRRILRYLKKADKLFENRKYDDAIFHYTRILKAAPNLEKARINLARCLYKMGRFEDAYDAFQDLHAKSLSPEARYESAQAALKVKDFASALAGFLQVPNGHPLYDLANYYGAICASNLKDYKQAAKLMRQAVVLPSKLMSSKRIYLDHIKEMIAQNEPKPTSTKDSPPPPSTAGQPARASGPAPDKPYGPGFAVYPTRYGLINDIAIQTQQFTQGEDDRHETLRSALAGSYSVRLPMNAKQKTSYPHILLYSRLRLGGTRLIGTESQLLNDDLSELRRLADQNRPTRDTATGELAAGLSPEWYLGQNFWFSLAGSSAAVVPRFEGSLAALHVIGQMRLGLQSPNLIAQTSFKMIETVQDSTRLFARTQEEITLHIIPESLFSLKIGGRASQYSYHENQIDGPNQMFWLKVDGILRFSESSHFSLGGHVEQFHGQRYHNLGELDAVGFDQFGSGAQMALEVSPIPAIQFSLVGYIHERFFDGIAPDVNQARFDIAENVPEAIVELTAQLSINRTF